MHSIHEIPIVGLVVPFGLGILIGDSNSYCSSSCLIFTSLALLFLFLLKYLPFRFRSQYFYPVSFVTILLAGFSYINIIDEQSAPQDIPIFQDMGFEGSVSNVKHKDGKVNCEFSIGSYFNQESTFTQKINAQLFISNTTEDIKNGDRLTVHGKLTPVSKNTNPNTFDYKDYLRHKYIFHQISIAEDDVLSHTEGQGWWYFPVRMNNYAQSVLKKYSCCLENAGIAIGMITGDKNEISKELLETYSRVGTMHLLAVSGLHVGIIATFLFWVFSFKSQLKDNFFIIVFIIAVIWAFVLFTGAKASTCRAGVMFTLLLLSRLTKQLYNPYNVIACSALILLLYDPHALFDLGFQLSYLAVVSIIFFYPRIYDWIDHRHLNKFNRSAWSLICISISANLLIIPISAFYFNQVSLSFVLSNFFAVPLAGCIVVGGFGLIFFDLISSYLSTAFAFIYYKLISCMNWALKAVDQIPHLLIENIQLDTIQLLTIYLTMFSLMIVLAKKKLQLFRYPLVFGLLFSGYSGYTLLNKSNELKFTVYDIYGKTVVDYSTGELAFHFSDQDLTEKSIEYNITPARAMTNTKKVVDLSRLENYKSQKLQKEKNLFVFANKLFFIPQSGEELERIPDETDFLIINHTRGIDQLRINDKTKVILTNNKYLNHWKINIPERQLIRISKHGAYTQILNDV